MTQDYKCCDDCFDPKKPEYTIHPFPGIDDCAVCGKSGAATHWQIGEPPSKISILSEANSS